MVDVNLIPKEYRGRKESLGAIFSKTGGIVLALLILSLLFYGGLLFYSQKLNKNLNSAKQQIIDLNSKRSSQLEEAIIKTDKKLVLVENLFKKHFYWSQIFSAIEALTVPQIYFSETKMAFTEEKLNIVFSGNSPTYSALAQQMVSFNEEPLIEKVEVSNIALNDEKGIAFDLSIIFSQNALLSPPQ